MTNATMKLPVAIALCEQLTAIHLGTYEGPAKPADALDVIEHLIGRSDFEEDERAQLVQKLKLAREVFPAKQVESNEPPEVVSKPASRGKPNPFLERLGVKTKPA